ncbi:MAG: glycosyltransferase [Bryobacteraceae bacterium]
MALQDAVTGRTERTAKRGMPFDAIEWVCHSPSPYNDYLFGTLAREFGDGFRVHYLHAASGTHPWRTEFGKGYRWRVYGRGLVDGELLRSVLGNARALLVTGAWQDATSELCMVGLARAGRPYLIWNDAPDLRKRRTWWKAAVRGTFLRFAFRHARAVMGTGPMALEAFQAMGCPAGKLVNFPYFIDVDGFPFRPARRGAVLELGTVARLSEEKGLDVGLEALARFRDREKRAFRYRIVGEGPAKGALQGLVHRLGLGESVEFAGWLEPDELPEFYRSVQALLHPARFEPYGIAVLEAMASGCVVVATRTTAAARDRLVDGESGFVAECSAEGLAAALGRLAAMTEPERMRMVRGARSAAEAWRGERAVEILRGLW